LAKLQEEQKTLEPSDAPKLPAEESPADANGDDKMEGIEYEEQEVEELPDSDEDLVPASRARSLRRADDRAAERKRKREEDQEKKEKAEAAAKVPKISPQLRKVLREIEKRKDKLKECEEEIATLDDDLQIGRAHV